MAIFNDLFNIVTLLQHIRPVSGAEGDPGVPLSRADRAGRVPEHMALDLNGVPKTGGPAGSRRCLSDKQVNKFLFFHIYKAAVG